MASSFNAPTAARDQKRKSSPLRERDDARPHPPMMPPAKKARFVWSTEHREQFVNAVTQLGNEAVPKKIHELMNIPGLTREHVASHLQKYRLKREKMGKAATEEIKHGPNNQLGSSCTRLFSTQAAYGGAYTCSTIAPQYDDDSNSNALHFHPLLFKEDAIFISPSSQQAAYAATHTTRAQIDYDHSNTTNIIIIP